MGCAAGFRSWTCSTLPQVSGILLLTFPICRNQMDRVLKSIIEMLLFRVTPTRFERKTIMVESELSEVLRKNNRNLEIVIQRLEL